MAAVAQGTDGTHLVTPPDGALGQGVEQHPAQVAALHLGTPSAAVVGFVEQDGAVRGEDPGGLAALEDQAAELLRQARGRQRRLTVVLVDVEHPALGARGRGRLRLVDGDRDAVDVQDAGQDESAEAGSDDRDVGAHRDSSRCWYAVPIVEAAVELLDAHGEGGLTFRALSERLATGPGAIYWHVTNKDELLAAATEVLVARALPREPPEAEDSPHDRVRTVALGLYDAIDDHPWLGPQLSAQISRSPSGSVTPRIFESLGRPIRTLGAPERSWFAATSALMYYVLGAAGQNAANARTVRPEVDRAQFLDAMASDWEALDPDEYPFTRAVADQLRNHDDREQFLAGITLILVGATAPHPSGDDRGTTGSAPTGGR